MFCQAEFLKYKPHCIKESYRDSNENHPKTSRHGEKASLSFWHGWMKLTYICKTSQFVPLGWLDCADVCMPIAIVEWWRYQSSTGNNGNSPPSKKRAQAMTLTTNPCLQVGDWTWPCSTKENQIMNYLTYGGQSDRIGSKQAEIHVGWVEFGQGRRGRQEEETVGICKCSWPVRLLPSWKVRS